MPLTRKQKNFIKDNRGKLSAEQLAAQLALNPASVVAFLQQQKFPSPENPASPETDPDHGFLRFFRQNRSKILLLVVAVFAVYLNTLGNGFVSDDRDLPLDYQKQTYWQKIFQPKTVYRIPIIFHYLDSLGGLAPWRYHLTNLLLHAAATLLVYFFLSYRLSALTAFLASLLFAVHPLHTDAVAWIVSRSYLLFTIFTLLSFILYLQSTTEGGALKNRRRYLLSLLFYVFAFESRWAEPVIFPVLLLFYDFCFRHLKRTWQLIAPYVLLDLTYLLFLINAFQKRVAETSLTLSGSVDWNNPLPQIPIAVITYLKLFIWPLDLTFYHEDLTVGPLSFLLYLVLFLVFLSLIVYLYFKNKTLFFFLALFLLSLLYTFTPLRIAWAIAERYTYFGSLGLAAVFASLFVPATKNTTVRTILLVIFTNLLLLYAARTVIRNFDWQNEDTLWVATVKTSPTSSKAWNNMGDYYARQGDLNASLNAFLRATQLNPTYADAWHNAGNTLMLLKRDEEALAYFQKAAQYNPGLYQSYLNVAVIKISQGKLKEAEDNLLLALKINPQEPRTYDLLGVVAFQKKDLAAAVSFFRQAISLDPGFTLAREHLQKVETWGKTNN